MVSRENRVALAAAGLFLVGVATLGFGVGNPVLGLLVAVVIPVVLPQLYLARTDDSVSSRARVWTAGGVALVFLATSYVILPPISEPFVLVLVPVVALPLLLYEVRRHRRASAT